MNVCAQPGCPTLSESTRCPEHQHEQQNRSRARYPRGTYGSEWPAIRRRQLRAHPDCQCTDPHCRCGGTCQAGAVEVDHIIPLERFTTRRVAHQPSNLQSLCKSCHSSKTARLDIRR